MTISVLGRDLLDVEISRDGQRGPEPQTANPAPEGETPGPVTDHHLGADTQLGFTSSTPRWSATKPISAEGERV